MSPVETAARLLHLDHPVGGIPAPAGMYAVLRDLVSSPGEVAELWDPVLALLAELQAGRDPLLDGAPGDLRARAA